MVLAGGMGLLGLVSACGAAPAHLGALEELERVRGAALNAQDVQLAPEARARAEQEREIALAAHASHDEQAAALHAERAMAAFAHARAVARLARATAELADAEKVLADATTEESSLETSRARLERDGEELERQIRVAREKTTPAASSTANPEREEARAVAARSLAMQGHLLCAAARLVTPDATGLREAEAEVTAVAERLAKGSRPVPIDDAAWSRAHCLDVLTRARRSAAYDAGAADALLAELSAAGGWDPSRDERGVTLTLHDAFKNGAGALTAPIETKLGELGRVAAAHPLFGVQVVIHDARAPVPGDTVDSKRADAAVQALVHGGAASAHVHAELAGALAPLVDPRAAKGRERNERLEVVFVAGGSSASATTAKP